MRIVAIDFLHMLNSPGGDHVFGTDQFGRDVFTRTVWGARVSLIVGLSVAAISSILGLALGLLCGYAFAWIGHFGFEKNKPASFKRPLYSFMGDWVMYKDIWIGRIPF